MKRRVLFNALLASGLTACPLSEVLAALAARSARRPARVALVTSGHYDRYRRVLMSVLQGLGGLGLLNDARLRPILEAARRRDRDDTADLWADLARERLGDLIFVPDAHIDYLFQEDVRRESAGAFFERLRRRADIDLVLTFGTAASQDMARGVQGTPVLSLASTDPVATGIIASDTDSGRDNVHAIVIKDFVENQLKTLYAVHPFKVLGFVHKAGEEKKFNVDAIRALCERLGAQCVTAAYEDDSSLSEAERFGPFRAAVETLLKKGVKTIAFPWFPATDLQLAGLVKTFVDEKVWSFSLSGPAFVSRGILLGAGEESFEGYGLFEARVIERVLKGESPRAIGQVFVQQNRYSINLRSAMQLGWTVPFEILATADRTYTSQSIVDD